MRLSIVTAVFNNRDTVAHALESLFTQTHPDIEPVVIDGGSTDGTLEILRSHRDRLSVLVSEPDRGVYDALNKGVGLASGDVVGFLHSDDLLAAPDALARVAAAFADPAVDGVYGDLVYVRRSDCEHVVRHWRAGGYSRARLAWGWLPPHPALFLRRRVYERFGLFDTSYRIAADYDFMLRVLQGGVRIEHLPGVLVKMRVGGMSNRTLANILRKSAEDYRALKANRVGGLGALTWKNLGKLPQLRLVKWPSAAGRKAVRPAS